MITYSIRRLVGLALLMVCTHSGSRRQFENEREVGFTAENLGRLIDEPGERTASTWTVDYLFRKMDPSGLETIPPAICRELIRARRLESFRFHGEYLVAVDGTELHRFRNRSRPHCAACLKQTHGNGTTDYFHSVLEAKLVAEPGLAFSMASEFIENDAEPYDKQDSELKAFYRLAPRLKAAFPRLPICLLLDSLYANETLLDICLANHWSFFVGFKQGSIPSLYAQMLEYIDRYPTQTISGNNERESYTCRWACNLKYRTHRLHALYFDLTDNKSGKETRFVYLTDHRPNAKLAVEMVNMGGRQRSKIENQGFNVQKTGGYELENGYGFREHAPRNYYFLVQIVHCLHQLMLHTDVNSKLTLQAAGPNSNQPRTGLQAFRSLRNLAKRLGEGLRYRLFSALALSADFARSLQLRFVFDTS